MSDWLHHPPRAASFFPFWFWNDAIDADAIRRSIADFEAHNVFGFVIHPRVGLPRSIGWMSDALLELMQVAIEEAARRDMRVILYDEGMYPSGSSSGQVVSRDPSLAARCLALHDADWPLPEDATLVTSFTHDGKRFAVIDRRADSYIRGLHYTDESTAAEDEPPAGDILNPDTTAAVIDLVYEKFADRFREHFGGTILGIFTDEPNALGKCREKNVFPGSLAVIDEITRRTGIDPRPSLPALWFDELPNASAIHAEHHHHIRTLLNDSWYAPLSRWCESNGLWLMGHPDAGDEIGVQRYFHAPGQDLVWRFVEPGKPTAIQGPESTQAKCTASAKLHRGRSRNSNEFAGAYGPQTTFDEVRWLARWCLVRGVDLLIPHAFYHSIRGPRRDERPPQLGPHTPSWTDGSFARFAAECQRLCALNLLGTPVADIAILTHGDRCPWRAAKVLLEHQRDFHYVEPDQLDGATHSYDRSITIGPHRYRAIVTDDPTDTPTAVRSDLDPFVVRFEGDEATLLAQLDRRCERDVTLEPESRDLRVRHVRVDGAEHVYLLFNEGNAPLAGPLSLAVAGEATWVDAETGEERSAGNAPFTLALEPWQLAVLRVR